MLFTIHIFLLNQPFHSKMYYKYILLFFSQIEEILSFFVYEKLIFITNGLLRYLPGYPEYRPRLIGSKVHSRDKRVPLKQI